MTKTLEMTFRDSLGKEVTITLPNPRTGLTLTEVQTVMQDIITKNVFFTKNGDLAQIADAKIRVVDITSLA